jgi:hypothetical protein
VRGSHCDPGPIRDNDTVGHSYTLELANELVPEVAARMRRLGELQVEAAAGAARARKRSRLNGHGSGIDPRVGEEIESALEWFESRGIQVKGITPPLVDFPADAGGREVLLCWTEGEEEIGYYHTPEAGFAGRRPVTDLGQV